MLRIGIVVCEASGDLLGASLVEQLREKLEKMRDLYNELAKIREDI